MLITLFEGARTNPLFSKRVEMSGRAFLQAVASETDVPTNICKTDDDKKAGVGFVLAQYKEHATNKKLTSLRADSYTEVFCFDIDEMTEAEISEALPTWEKYSIALYSTYAHSVEKPHYRLLVELAETVPNYNKEPFHGLYMATARALKIKADPKALDRARFFFGPQCKENSEVKNERHLFAGVPFKCVSGASLDTVEASAEETFTVARDKPSRQVLSKTVTRMRKSALPRMKSLASALDAVLRGDEFAPKGSMHNTSMELAFELVREFPNLDGKWFALEYFRERWMRVCPDHYDKAMGDWMNSVESAEAKHAETNARVKADRAFMSNLLAHKKGKLSDAEIERAITNKNRLVMSYRGSYFIYEPRSDCYKGPFVSAEVAVAVRDMLGSVPGIDEQENSKSGQILKSAVKLNHQYGSTVDSVMYFAKKPPKPFDVEGNAIYAVAYKWIEWRPVYHEIADDLLRAVTGRHYELVEAYLTKFRDLSQPLPALTLVGPKGCWKSRICEILSRFWTTKHGPSPGKAEKIMARFNDHLLVNPVVWSDEQLALTSQGKPQPEAYRESITSKIQTIEKKGMSIIQLSAAIRHVIAVNNDDKIFSSEVDTDSIYATMERFLLLYVEGDLIKEVEDKWRGSPEMDALREGSTLLEHIRWIEENRQYESTGRLFVQPHTEAQILLRARFSDDVLLYIWQVAIEALKKEASFSHKGQIERLPLYCKSDGNLYLSPSRVQDLWGNSKATEGSMIRKPTNQKIGTILSKAGFKSIKGARATKNKFGGWKVEINTLKQFIEVSDFISWEDLSDLCFSVFGIKVNDSEGIEGSV